MLRPAQQTKHPRHPHQEGAAINDVTYVNLPGQVWGLAAPGADGPVLATSYCPRG